MLWALLGASPDLDLLFGAHSTYTHSIGAVAVTAAVVLLWTRGRQVRVALACAAAVASHVLLDWLGTDTTPPLGVMALWPFTREFYQSPVFLFMAISRRWWLPGFYTQNALAAVRELVILTPIVALIGTVRTRSIRRA
jgi:inner membrane protein